MVDRFGIDLEDPKKEEKKEEKRAMPPPPTERPHWVSEDGSLKPFGEIHKLSQWTDEEHDEITIRKRAGSCGV